MCLELNDKIIESIADDDIICYKIVQIDKNILRTYYQHALISIGETYHSDLIVESDFPNYYYNDNTRYYINIGLHSFKHEQNCLDFLDKKHLLKSKYFRIVKCTIPKGSNYLSGLFQEYDSYASNQLRYDSITTRRNYNEKIVT